ncbi:DJ-1/PfpI family protein [Halomarina ordinaria]|uniref:DJ-1/PfpI family protein n=1 Tax=Halomarina ordinaria TaxID=3033939 RepID=A0ABD5UBH1_9EURY|nr:DJ-1/PfpI family protein [Halomarina sp. PSRA2]
MRIAFVVYDELTALDFVGVYDPVTRLVTMGFRDDVSWEICAPPSRATVTATGGLSLTATEVGEPLDAYDAVIVPGTVETEAYRTDVAFVDWLRTAADCEYKVSVCTGAVLLGAAGLLDGHRATTHPMAFEELAQYATVVEDRVVDDGDVITARGVTSAIDLGLHLCYRWGDEDVRAEIKAQMDYPYGDDLLSGVEPGQPE